MSGDALATAPAGPLTAFPVERVGDRGFVLLPDAPVLPEGLTWTELKPLDAFFSGLFTTLEIADAPALDRARVFSLPGVHDERELATTRAVFLRVRRGASDPEVASHPSIGVERELVALEVDLAGVSPRGAPFVFSGPAAGRRRIERENVPYDKAEEAALDAWLAAAGHARADEAISQARFAGTDIDELFTAVEGDRLAVWRRGGSTLAALRMPTSESVWGHLVATTGELLLVIEHGRSGLSGTGVERWMTIQPLPR